MCEFVGGDVLRLMVPSIYCPIDEVRNAAKAWSRLCHDWCLVSRGEEECLLMERRKGKVVRFCCCNKERGDYDANQGSAEAGNASAGASLPLQVRDGEAVFCWLPHVISWASE
jgi:hypothetical protein